MSTTFKVDPVSPPSHPRMRTTEQDDFFYEFDRIKIKPRTIEAYKFSTDGDIQMYSPAQNAFAYTALRAYNEHAPIAFSPDEIWLVVLQAFTSYISKNPEEARHAIVDFEGKKTLRVINSDFVKGSNRNPWEREFQKFSNAIAGYLGNKRDLFDPSFTTTTPTTKAAIQVQMMSALSSYFDYEMETRCGVPTITLLGEVADWAAIQVRVEQAAEFYPAWAHKPLLTAVEHFHKAANGKPDLSFWQNFFKTKNGSGGTPVNGWINAFFPYVGEDGEKNKLLTGAYETTFLEAARDRKHNSIGAFGGSITSVPMLWVYYGTEYKMRLASGIFGTTINDDGQFQSVLGWAVGEEIK